MVPSPPVRACTAETHAAIRANHEETLHVVLAVMAGTRTLDVVPMAMAPAPVFVGLLLTILHRPICLNKRTKHWPVVCHFTGDVVGGKVNGVRSVETCLKIYLESCLRFRLGWPWNVAPVVPGGRAVIVGVNRLLHFRRRTTDIVFFLIIPIIPILPIRLLAIASLPFLPTVIAEREATQAAAKSQSPF